MSATTEVKLTVDRCRATIVFSSENGVNVMSSAAMEKLAEAVEGVRRAGQVRAAVLRAEGKAFIAGADIKEMRGFDRETARKFSARGNEVMDALAGLPCITVAALNGAAMGGGCEIALACDFRIAAAKVKIGLPETSLGLIPGWGGTKRALQLLGPARGRHLIFSATPLSAEQAATIGLVDEVVADGTDLERAVDGWIKWFERGGPRAIGLAKRALLTGDEAGCFAECFAGEESTEGMAAFVEKRAARWMES
ncbi:MAG: enoyl-CoA hydratase/isomerase family protein [Phycisphaerae bacterium]